MRKILPLLLLTMTFLFSSQMGVVHSLDPNGDGFLSIRTKPKGREIGKLYNGDKVKILSKKGKYYKIKKVSSGMVGYAHSNWIRKSSKNKLKITNIIHPKDEPKGLYIVDFRVNDKNKKYRMYCPTNTVRNITNGQWSKSTKASGNIAKVLKDVCSSKKVGVVQGLDPNGDGFLSLRTKPKGREIGKLYNGDKVKILAKRGKWYKVKTVSAGQVGWAHGGWIRKTSLSLHSVSTPSLAIKQTVETKLSRKDALEMLRFYYDETKPILNDIKQLPIKLSNDIKQLPIKLSNDIKRIPIQYRKDKQFILDLIADGFGEKFKFADESLKKDKEFVLAVIKEQAKVYKYADTSLKKDRDFTMSAIKQNNDVFQFLNENFKKDREIVLAVVRQNGGQIVYADDSFRKDKEIALIIVKQDPSNIILIDKSLENDKDILLIRNSQRKDAISYAIKNNDKILLGIVLKKYENQCNAGNSDECKILGDIYLYGAVGKVDIKKASTYYQKAKIEEPLITLLNSDNYKIVNDFDKSHFYQIKECSKVYGYGGYTSTIIQVKPTLDMAIEYSVECDKNNTFVGLRLDYDNGNSWFKILQVDNRQINLENQTYYKLSNDSLVAYISEPYKEKLSQKIKKVRKNFDKASDSEKKRLLILEQMLSEKGFLYSEIKQTNILKNILKNPTIFLYNVQGNDTKLFKY